MKCIECGDHYVRAMSSWSLLLAATDFGWDTHHGELTLGNHSGQNRLVAPFFAAPAWGTYEIDAKGDVTIRVIGGEIEVKSIVLKGVATGDATVRLDDIIVDMSDGIYLQPGSVLTLTHP
ncbi:MAG: hypothetical protein M9953_03180 [Thermomicrobiales bacterium]|nr:hypothetical protein [Thermomicrobiales bacterium]MCO5218643.1 hypothetical protein [Thermomicrobiales bacterium]MCO5224320.1 hypothetical protein [Thermomicrobiales bacterium]MCO5229059.1 hypothetical protein [Thermomicrobiales bacterium]